MRRRGGCVGQTPFNSSLSTSVRPLPVVRNSKSLLRRTKTKRAAGGSGSVNQTHSQNQQGAGMKCNTVDRQMDEDALGILIWLLCLGVSGRRVRDCLRCLRCGTGATGSKNHWQSARLSTVTTEVIKLSWQNKLQWLSLEQYDPILISTRGPAMRYYHDMMRYHHDTISSWYNIITIQYYHDIMWYYHDTVWYYHDTVWYYHVTISYYHNTMQYQKYCNILQFIHLFHLQMKNICFFFRIWLGS